MESRTPTSALLGCAAVTAGVIGYVLTFYVMSAVWPLVGVLLMLVAAFLAVAAVVRSRRRLTIVLAVAAMIPLAVFVFAVAYWLQT